MQSVGNKGDFRRVGDGQIEATAAGGKSPESRLAHGTAYSGERGQGEKLHEPHAHLGIHAMPPILNPVKKFP